MRRVGACILSHISSRMPHSDASTQQLASAFFSFLLFFRFEFNLNCLFIWHQREPKSPMVAHCAINGIIEIEETSIKHIHKFLTNKSKIETIAKEIQEYKLSKDINAQRFITLFDHLVHNNFPQNIANFF
ncbi:hypothetical protein BpHYR1_006373 [Brachionus plicatilis]|uniref:Uncharacterized protein n=1 Tax=Brachionus plicatilis TaxID=10195 RepID=A0A3M7R6U3_BRAPC|nr:hypothetical protein BpHYR1_006373 [Brachionus plicatilis]